jgi:hypothetical protein
LSGRSLEQIETHLEDGEFNPQALPSR